MTDVPLWRRQDGAACARQRTLLQFRREQAIGIDRAGHGELTARHARKAEALVIGPVADEEHEGMAEAASRIQRTPKKSGADAPVLEGRVDGERAEHQARLLAGPDRRQAHRSDQKRADERREGQFETVWRPLADAVGGARETARPEGALVQPLD